jgi:hypothetical protein
MRLASCTARCPIPPPAPKIITDSPRLSFSAGSSPHSAVIASTGSTPACSTLNLPGIGAASVAFTAAYCA